MLRSLALGLIALGVAGAAGAHGHADGAPADLPPVAARYVLSLDTGAAAPTPAPQAWYVYRSANRLVVIKGAVEETWARDARGHISFERVFHEDKRRVFYSPNELKTLGIEADWGRLARLADTAGGARTQWDTVHQLPRSVHKRLPSGEMRFTLEDTAAHIPPGWPQPGQGLADYVQWDVADLADMEYDPVARKAAAHDVRAGWRVAHAH